MRVAHLVSTFPPYKGGIGNAAYHLSWELSKLNVDVTVFTLYTKHYENITSSLPFRLRRLHPLPRYGNAGFIPQLLWQLRGFDIVHLHYPFFGGAEMLYLLERIRHITVVIHYHMDVYGEGIMQNFFSWHTNHVMPRILNTASAIVVTSMDYALQSNIRDIVRDNPHKCVEIPLGVNADVFMPRRKNNELAEALGVKDKKVILWVGALDRAHYFKGVNYLIKAFQLISSNDEYRLILVGTGNLRQSYESLAINFGLERKVHFAGYVSDDLLPQYYNLADVFAFPSVDGSEAFGIALLEAMASGLPVIASDLPGVRSVVDRNRTGLLIKPKQVDLLAQSIDHLLKNPQKRNEFSIASRWRILTKYTWDRIGRELYDVYKAQVE